MGLAVRVIPTLLIRGDTLVKGKQFQSWRSVGHPMQAMRVYQQRKVDEIILLDIGATPEGRGPNFKLIEKLALDCFSPLTVGGGVRNVADVRDLLNAGADKVAICTAAAKRPTLINVCADKFGSQAIVVSIDHLQGVVAYDCGKSASAKTALDWACVAEVLGAGEILLTNVSGDGMLWGYHLTQIEMVAKATTIPVIASGGCGNYEHMLQAIQAGASAVAASAMFQFTDQTPRGAVEYLHAHGVEVRL